MDQKQIEKQLTWLDEQHRKTTASIKELKDQLTDSHKQLETQSDQIAELSNELARLAGLTSRIHQVDETLQQHRKEVTRLLEDFEKRRSEKESNLEALRKSDQKAIALRIDQLQAEIKALSELEQGLETRRQEEIRLGKQADKIEKRTEKMEDISASMEDQVTSLSREQDKTNKTLQKSESELDHLKKSVEEIKGRLEILADGNRSIDIRISELLGAESERLDGQAKWIERQELSIVEFENSWKKWGRRFDAIEQQASEFDERLAAYEELHRALKQMRTELAELMERLERRITEISEMQRLSDHRVKHEWSTFQAEDLKRWNTYKLTTDELWREHERLHEHLTKQYEEFSESLSTTETHLNRLLEADRLRLGEMLSMLREWVSESSDRTGS